MTTTEVGAIVQAWESRYVLVVDDRADEREEFQQIFKYEGVHLLEAATSGQAVSHIEKTPIAIFILAEQLPDESGAEFLEGLDTRLRESILTFLITDNDNRTVKDATWFNKTRDLGVAGYFSRPLVWPQVRVEVAYALSALRVRRDAVGAPLPLQTWYTTHTYMKAEKDIPSPPEGEDAESLYARAVANLDLHNLDPNAVVLAKNGLYVSVNGAAEILGVSPEQAQVLASRGRLGSGIKPGGRDVLVPLNVVLSRKGKLRRPGRPPKGHS